MKKLTVVFAVAAMLAGCAAKLEKIPMQESHTYDKDTNFAFKEESDGFLLTVDDRLTTGIYPWGIGLNAAVTSKCKSQVISIARELSDKTGRKIKPVNEESITISTDAEGYCHAQAKVEWE